MPWLKKTHAANFFSRTTSEFVLTKKYIFDRRTCQVEISPKQAVSSVSAVTWLVPQSFQPEPWTTPSHLMPCFQIFLLTFLPGFLDGSCWAAFTLLPISSCSFVLFFFFYKGSDEEEFLDWWYWFYPFQILFILRLIFPQCSQLLSCIFSTFFPFSWGWSLCNRGRTFQLEMASLDDGVMKRMSGRQRIKCYVPKSPGGELRLTLDFIIFWPFLPNANM